MDDVIEVWRIRRPHKGGDSRELASPTSRAILRLILAHYTHIPADKLSFVFGRNGKPYLDATQNEGKLTFNFSHSGDMALLAVSWDRELGVDVEKVREVARSEEIAHRRLSPKVAEELRNAAEGERSRVFLQNWARHEALLKARAGTIWHPGGGPVDLPRSRSAQYVDQIGDFTVRDLDTGRDYVGALAAPGDGWTIAVRDYAD